ncbi:hypothetical protein BDR05DRAFT_880583, partial [Suillus weaverae]
LTIHKSQSQTLNKVVVDLDWCFADGQAYIMLSWARSKEGLEIHHFNLAKVSINTKALSLHSPLFSNRSPPTKLCMTGTYKPSSLLSTFT